jgi:hypothetical protein
MFAVLGAVLIVGAEEETPTILEIAEKVDFSGVKTNDDRIAFISQFGIKVNGEAVECEEFRVPENFDRIIAGYNEIQKSQGLSLEKYKNKKVTRYTYEATGYEGAPGTVYVNLIIYRGTVIACDVSSTDPEGFIEPLIKL